MGEACSGIAKVFMFLASKSLSYMYSESISDFLDWVFLRIGLKFLDLAFLSKSGECLREIDFSLS